MRSHFLLALLIIFSSKGLSHAAVIENSALIRESLNIRGEVLGEKIKFEATEKWTNVSEKDQSFTWVQPTTKENSEIDLYLNLEKKSVTQVLDRLDFVSEIVEETEDPFYFSMTSDPFEKLWKSSELTIPPGKTWDLKYTWKEPISSVGDFSSSTVFLGRSKNEKEFKVTLVFDQAIKHFVPLRLEAGNWLTESGESVWQFEKQDFEKPQKLEFLWAKDNRAHFSYARDEFIYKANFIAPVPQKKPEESVLIMIDQSGSMYGNRWSRVQDLLPEVLRLLGSDKKIKIGLFDDEWNFLTDGFEANTFEQQKHWSEIVSDLTPTGRSDWAAWINFLKSLDTSDRFDEIIAIGDFSDLEVPLNDTSWESFSKPVVFLDFGKNKSLKLWSESFGGNSVEMFSSTYEFLELPMFTQAWNYLNQHWSLENEKLTDSETETRPQVREKYNPSQVFITRSLRGSENVQNQDLADFLPAWWGQYQIAHHLRKNLKAKNFSGDSASAIGAISRYYGLGLPDSFLGSFVSGDKWSRKSFIEDYEKALKWDTFMQTYHGEPIYNFVPFSYESEASDPAKRGLSVQPFSEAYFELYRDFPSFVSAPFSWGKTPKFCTKFRCVEIKNEGESGFNGAQRLFWNRHFGSHWADEYIEKLAKENILEVPVSGELDLASNITRGEFMTWVAEYLFESELENYELPEIPVFSDLPTSLAESKSLSLLKEKGIIEGFAGNLVKSDQVLLRAEAVKILLAIKGFNPSVNDLSLGAPLPFKDLVSWEIPWVLEAQKRSIVEGYEDQTFRPFNSLNRAEAAKILIETFEDN